MKRKDPLPGKEFTPTRTNQKFENPENRIAYYNNKANALRVKNSFINKPLHNNVMILNELLHNRAEATFKKEFLSGKGFTFNVHTHLDSYQGQPQYAIYQYLIIVANKDEIKFVKKC